MVRALPEAVEALLARIAPQAVRGDTIADAFESAGGLCASQIGGRPVPPSMLELVRRAGLVDVPQNLAGGWVGLMMSQLEWSIREEPFALFTVDPDVGLAGPDASPIGAFAFAGSPGCSYAALFDYGTGGDERLWVYHGHGFDDGLRLCPAGATIWELAAAAVTGVLDALVAGEPESRARVDALRALPREDRALAASSLVAIEELLGCAHLVAVTQRAVSGRRRSFAAEAERARARISGLYEALDVEPLALGRGPVELEVDARAPRALRDRFASEPPETVALIEAAAAGHAREVERLLGDGGDPSVRDCEGWTALHHAARSGSESVVRTLLGAGASAGTPDAHGVTPMHRAAERGAQSTVEVLLANGAAIDAADDAGRTPLMAAADAGDRVMIDLLIARGADPSRRDSDGLTAAERAERLAFARLDAPARDTA